MKRLIVSLVVGGFCGFAAAQSYVGAVWALTNIGYDCPSGSACDKSGKGLKFYGGTSLPNSAQIDLGVGRVQSFEVAYSRFGKVSSSSVIDYSYYDSVSGLPATRPAEQVEIMQADAISAVFVARFPIVDSVAISARLGAAFVSSTLKTEIDGRSNKSETATKLKPYASVGVEYEVPSVIKIVGGVDLTGYDVGGRKGTMRMVSLGAEKTF